jgi:hypothetical protein
MYAARGAPGVPWRLHAAQWWLIFATSEIAQAIGAICTPREAIAGIVCETIDLPIVTHGTERLIGRR